jgi:energy-converting hydrogenase Eha subunit B
VTITDVGSSFLSDANIPIIYTIVQRVMGVAAFAVLAIIIFQTFKMLTDPTNEENLGNIRKTILYVLLGMLVIGAGYLIVNVLLIN